VYLYCKTERISALFNSVSEVLRRLYWQCQLSSDWKNYMLLPFFDQWPRNITCFCDVFLAALDATAASYAFVLLT
jgi:hypothetical protein